MRFLEEVWGREVYRFEPNQTLEADEEVFEAEVG